MYLYLYIGLVVLSMAFSFWALLDVSKSRFKENKIKTMWLLVVLFFPIVGSIIYFQQRKGLVTKEPRMFQPVFNK